MIQSHAIIPGNSAKNLLGYFECKLKPQMCRFRCSWDEVEITVTMHEIKLI